MKEEVNPYQAPQTSGYVAPVRKRKEGVGGLPDTEAPLTEMSLERREWLKSTCAAIAAAIAMAMAYYAIKY